MRMIVLMVAVVLFSAHEELRAGLAPGPDAFGYTVQPTTQYSFIQITNAGAVRVLWFDDDTSYTANIGFTFNFYGSDFTTVSFNPNGLLTFGGVSSDYSNVNLVTTSPTNDRPAIAVLWDDWETQENWADAVYFRTDGAAGSREFIIQWNKIVPVNGDGTNTVTFEARLFEGSNRILYSYFDVVVSDESNPVASLGIGATVGIRDVNGQNTGRNLEWSFNQGVITNGLNLLYSLPNRPPIAAADAVTTLEDATAVISVLDNDSDPDLDALGISLVTQGAHGIVQTNGDGTITYQPATNFFGPDQFNYVINDGHGGSATGLVSVTVVPVNDPPTLDGIGDLILKENPSPEPISLTGISSGAANENDSLSISAQSSNPALIPTPEVNYISPNSSGTLTLVVRSNVFGTATISVKVSDGRGSNDVVTRSFTVTVQHVNHPPDANPDSVDIYQDRSLDIASDSLLANDSDADVSDELMIVEVTPATSLGGSVSLLGLRNETIRYVPPAHVTGSDSFNYVVSDGEGGSATGHVAVTIWPLPIISSIEVVSNGDVVLRFQGIPGKSHAMEASEDLVTWTDAGTGTESSPGEFVFEEVEAQLFISRFYRVRAF